MRHRYLLNCLLGCFLLLNTLQAQTVWTGPKTTFTKTDGADWTLAVNQDRITSNVWITRADSKGIFNIKTESSYTSYISPADTRWAFGTTLNYTTLTYDTWENTVLNPATALVGENMVLHLISDNVYIDIKFLSWASGGSGGLGGFSYERSTDQTLGITDDTIDKTIKIHPNPASSFIKLSHIDENEPYKIYNILGVKISEGFYNNLIDLQNFKSGIYILHLKNGNALRFVKK